MQGACVANQTASWLRESQAMLYTSTAIKCPKLRESGRDLSLKTGVLHSISMLSLKKLCHKFACTFAQ